MAMLVRAPGVEQVAVDGEGGGGCKIVRFSAKGQLLDFSCSVHFRSPNRAKLYTKRMFDVFGEENLIKFTEQNYCRVSRMNSRCLKRKFRLSI